MSNKFKKVVYIKHSSHGAGSIPIGAEGTVLKQVDNPETVKLLVDFSNYGLAIVPLSSVKPV